MEIGGYIEFPRFSGDMMHENALALNSARNCLAYLIEAKKIEKIALPKFLCASVGQVCEKCDVRIRYYSIGKDFLPDGLSIDDDEWLYLVNYYGQIDNEKIEKVKVGHNRLIVDNVQAYFQMPLKNTDTIYTCRKYFGVPDGAFLYTDTQIERMLDQDCSAKRMAHLLGRFEQSANEHYSEYTTNESVFENLPLKRMSKLTENLLHGIDYEMVKVCRERNYIYLERAFAPINILNIKMPEGAFMYPLYVSDGMAIRKKLQSKKIYIPTLWPDVFDLCTETELEFDMSKNILPLPCDQRYGLSAMAYLVNTVRDCISQEK